MSNAVEEGGRTMMASLIHSSFYGRLSLTYTERERERSRHGKCKNRMASEGHATRKKKAKKNQNRRHLIIDRRRSSSLLPLSRLDVSMGKINNGE